MMAVVPAFIEEPKSAVRISSFKFSAVEIILALSLSVYGKVVEAK